MENNINNPNSLDYKNQETIEENKNYNENLINTKSNFSFYQKYKIYIFILASIIIITLIIVLLVYLTKDKSSHCEIGDEDKCLTCKEDECGSCNIGYKLVNGKCILNYSFKAIYFTSENNTNIQLFHKSYSNEILEMNIDGN